MFFDRFIPYFHLKCLLLMKVFHSLIKKKKKFEFLQVGGYKSDTQTQEVQVPHLYA